MESPRTNRTKVLLVITKSNFGGAQRYVYDLSTSLPKDQFEVAVAYGGHGKLESKLQDASIRTIPISALNRDVNLLKEFSVFIQLVRLFWSERPDVVHLNSSKIGALGALAARIARVKHIVFTAHGWAFNENRSALTKMVLKVIYFTTIHLSHSTVTVSNAMQKQVSSWPGTLKKLRVIHNGIHCPNLLPKEEARAALADRGSCIDLGGEWFGFTGELHHIKGYEYALTALSTIKASYPKLQYIICGEGELKPTLERMIGTLGLKDRVHLLGYVENVPQYLAAFDAFLLPSLSEGLSYGLLEAGCAKLPVIASDVGGIPEVLEHGVTGILVKPRSSASLASAMEHLLATPATGQRLGSTLHEKVATHFSNERMVEATVAVYRAR